MAMSVDDCLLMQPGKPKIRVFHKKVAERNQPLRQPVRVFIEWKQPLQFIAKNTHATGFEPNNWDFRPNFFAQRNQNLGEQLLRVIEHSKIIERTAAA